MNEDEQTPEDRYTHWRAISADNDLGDRLDIYALRHMIDALNDMIASRDAEIDRQLAVLTRHENAIAVLTDAVRRMNGGRS